MSMVETSISRSGRQAPWKIDVEPARTTEIENYCDGGSRRPLRSKEEGRPRHTLRGQRIWSVKVALANGSCVVTYGSLCRGPRLYLRGLSRNAALGHLDVRRSAFGYWMLVCIARSSRAKERAMHGVVLRRGCRRVLVASCDGRCNGPSLSPRRNHDGEDCASYNSCCDAA